MFCEPGEGIQPCPLGSPLGNILLEYGVTGPLIQALYDQCQSLVHIAGSKSDSFPLRVGLYQWLPFDTDSVLNFNGQNSNLCCGVERAEPKGKSLDLPAFFIPTLTYGNKIWVVTKRTRLWIQAAKMSFLHRVPGLSLRDRVTSCVIGEELGVEPLVPQVEKSQMRWISFDAS